MQAQRRTPLWHYPRSSAGREVSATMLIPRKLHYCAAAAVLALCYTVPSLAQPNFGDNTSRWANDDECDDPRFEGEGSADTLLEEDNGHDANDCRKLFNAGRVALRSATRV